MAFAGRVNHDVANQVTDVFVVKSHNGMTLAPAFRLVVMHEPTGFHDGLVIAKLSSSNTQLQNRLLGCFFMRFQKI